MTSKAAGRDSKLEHQLREIIESAPWYETLASIRDLHLPDWFVAGGAVRNTVWQRIHAAGCSLKIKDLDLVFFDHAADRALELRAKESLQMCHPNWVFDVKNQASFGVWRPWHFVFSDTADGIAHFLHTATAVGVRLLDDDSLSICQPYGLGDLFDGIIRITPYDRHGSDAAQAKKNEFLSQCSGLSVLE